MPELNFDTSTTAPSTGFEVLPPGDYVMCVKESGGKDTAVKNPGDKPGHMLTFTFEVLDGPHKGRLIFENFNIVNANAKTVEIARAQLTALCYACGKFNPVKQTEELHRIPFTATVAVEPAKGEYAAKNRVKKYHFKKPDGTTNAGPSAGPTEKPGEPKVSW